jgi:general secretion pathway protein I
VTAPRARGFTLLEVLVALTILAVGVVALQRLAVQSVATIGSDARATDAMLLARGLLAEAAVAPPEPGRSAGVRGPLRWVRDVTRAVHPRLREVRVRISRDGETDVELVELIRVPTS